MDWSPRVEAGAWIAPGLSAFGTSAASVVPSGFARYARVFHPAGTDARQSGGTSWSVVAAWSGATVQADTAWLDVALPQRRSGVPLPWNGRGPDTGSYPPAISAAAVEVLRDHTHDPDDVWAGSWDGWGDLPLPAGVPRLMSPHRTYVLRHGTLHDTSRIEADPPWSSRPPNLWWPGDRSWCVASEIDADCTYVGGSAALIEDVIAHPGIEAVPIDPAATSVALTAPTWLGHVLADAVGHLRRSGVAELDLSRGTVTAVLRPPTRGRVGELTVTSIDDHGGRRGSTSPVGPADIDTQLPAALLWAVYELTI